VSLLWKFLETVDYSLLRAAGRWPKPGKSALGKSSESASAHDNGAANASAPPANASAAPEHS
jgi:hypothetical protein